MANRHRQLFDLLPPNLQSLVKKLFPLRLKNCFVRPKSFINYYKSQKNRLKIEGLRRGSMILWWQFRNYCRGEGGMTQWIQDTRCLTGRVDVFSSGSLPRTSQVDCWVNKIRLQPRWQVGIKLWHGFGLTKVIILCNFRPNLKSVSFFWGS